MLAAIKANKQSKIILIGMVIVFLLSLAPLIIEGYWLHLLMEILILGLFAVSLNLILGYGGMISFGHAGFYGVGVYISAGLLKNGIALPFALLTGALTAAVGGLVIGLFCVRLRSFYFAILTLAFGQLIWAIIFKWYTVTGGEDGLIGVPVPAWISSETILYFFLLTVCTACICMIYWKVNTPFGRVLSAIRENSERTESIGINVNRHRLVAFILSTFFAGLAGGLHCLLTRSAFPDLVEWSKSGEVLLTCILGGMYSFVGPLVGSVVMVLLNSLVAAFFIERWPLVLGVIFVMVALFIPQGIVGYLQLKIRGIRRGRRR